MIGIAMVLAITTTAAAADTSTYATVISPSITVYFTPGTAASGSTSEMKDALLAFIGTATATIDVAIFNLADGDIVDKLNAMRDAGVAVRIVYDDAWPISGLRQTISKKNDNHAAHMHNKFVIVDNAAVWTGSANFTSNNLTSINNNALLIKNASVATAYKTEFEQMWAGKFHEAKAVSGNNLFTVDGIPVEVYFSPQDHPVNRLNDLASAASSSLYFAVYTFGHSTLASTFLAKKSLPSLGIFDQSQLASTHGPYDTLKNGGFNTMIDINPMIMHHKFAVIDGVTVATGSMNFTVAGNDSNDENHVIIHNTTAAVPYLAEIARLSGQSTTSSTITTTTTTTDNLRSYPNPFRPGQGSMTISSGSQTIIRGAKIYGLDGRLIVSLPGGNTTAITWDGRNNRGELLGSGTYYIEITPATGKPVRRTFTFVR